MNYNYTDTDYEILLPSATLELSQIFSQLKLFSKQRLDTDSNPQGPLSQSQIKGLKFISSKLAKLFSKNRKLPYNQISKILIDNFAHQQKDQRNIKRRVYDAINVLVAAGILVKKNNSVEMIKNKMKGKMQAGRKDKIQEQIREKEEKLGVKKEIYCDMVRKHKLIRKLFDRNVRESSIRQGKLKKTRTRNDAANSMEESRALVSVNPSNSIALTENFIYQPRLFIFTTQNMGQKKVQNSLLTNFQSQNRLQVMVPIRKKRPFEPILLQSRSPFKHRDWMVGMEEKMEQESMQEEDLMGENNQERMSQFISEYGVYTLLELLELLTLNQVGQQ